MNGPITFDINVGGMSVNPLAFAVRVGCFGQIGTASIVADRGELLQSSGFDLAKSASMRGADASISVNGQKLFGGTYFGHQRSLRANEVTLICRDYAGQLVDTCQSLADFDTQNQTAAQIMQQIAQRGGLTADIQGADTIVGDLTEQGAQFATHPQPLWDLIVLLARATGTNFYVSPDKQLIVAPTMAGTIFQYSWREGADAAALFGSTGTDMAIDVEIQDQVARNGSFQVVVLSEHQKDASMVTGIAINVADDISSSTGQAAGIYVGGQANPVSQAISDGNLTIPKYEFHIAGLTQAQAEAKAQGLAFDIAKRLLMVAVHIEGEPAITPLDKVQLLEGEPGALDGLHGVPLYISGLHHTYQTPSGLSSTGFLTTVTLLTVPENIQAAGAGGGGFSGGLSL